MNLWNRLPKELQNVIMEHKETIELLDIYQNFADKYDLKKSKETKKQFNNYITPKDIYEMLVNRCDTTNIDMELVEKYFFAGPIEKLWSEYDLEDKHQELDNFLNCNSHPYNYLYDRHNLFNKYYQQLFCKNPHVYQIPLSIRIFLNLYNGQQYCIRNFNHVVQNQLVKIVKELQLNSMIFGFQIAKFGILDNESSAFVPNDYFVIMEIPSREGYIGDYDEIVVNLNTNSSEYGKIVLIHQEGESYITFLADTFSLFIKNFYNICACIYSDYLYDDYCQDNNTT